VKPFEQTRKATVHAVHVVGGNFQNDRIRRRLTSRTSFETGGSGDDVISANGVPIFARVLIQAIRHTETIHVG
jgi:hypothetical protein